MTNHTPMTPPPPLPGEHASRRYDILLCDIDGCLISELQKPLDIAALSRVAEHNRLAHERHDRPALTVCSGRPQPFAEGMCRLLGNLSTPCVAENGVWLYHPGTNEYLMDPAITEGHLAAVSELAGWSRATFGPLGTRQQPGKTASVTLYHPDTKLLSGTIRGEVENECAKRGWPFRISMTWYYINCDLTHVSKGSGVDRLLAMTKTPKARLAGIGDTVGDRCIAERTAFFACPANAQAEVKTLAQYVSHEEEAHGVLDILTKVVG